LGQVIRKPALSAVHDMADVLDIAGLMSRIDGDLEFLADMLRVYEEDRLVLVSQMRDALSRRDGGVLADAAHSLRGLAQNLSAEAVSDAALKLEEVANKGEFAAAEEIFLRLETEATRLKVALQGLLDRGEQPSSRVRPEGSALAGRPTRIITVDDQELVRKGIRFVLRTFDDITLVGEASSGTESLRLCEELRPDVVLMDVRMPNLDGIAATRTIRRQYPDTQVVVLTVYHNSALVTEAMQAGAIGYVMKDASGEELVGAIRAATEGHATLSPEAATDLVARFAPSPVIIGDDLTERERQVLGLLAKGMRNNQIAKQINKSPYTVRHYVSEVMAKLGANNRAEAAAIAVKHGLVE